VTKKKECSGDEHEDVIFDRDEDVFENGMMQHKEYFHCGKCSDTWKITTPVKN
jgi:hypothetical protein